MFRTRFIVYKWRKFLTLIKRLTVTLTDEIKSELQRRNRFRESCISLKSVDKDSGSSEIAWNESSSGQTDLKNINTKFLLSANVVAVSSFDVYKKLDPIGEDKRENLRVKIRNDVRSLYTSNTIGTTMKFLKHLAHL